MATFSQAQYAWLLDRRDAAIHLYLHESDTSKQKEVSLYNAAYILFLDGNIAESDSLANQSLRYNSRYGPALFLKGMIEFQRKNIRNGVTYLRASARTHPFPEIPDYYLGLLLFQNNKYDEALDALKKAISENKQYTLPYPVIGEILIMHKKYSDAIEMLQKALKISYDAEIIYMLAVAYEKNGNLIEAKKYFGLFTYLFPAHQKSSETIQWLKNHNVNQPYKHRFVPNPKRDEEDRFFPVGENVVYSVYWGPIRVGELNTIIAESLNFQGHDAYKVIFSLDSNPALEFIASLHSDYITIIDQSTKQVLQHFLHLRENKIVSDKVYDFFRNSGKFICRSVEADGHIQYLEKYLPENTIDGTSILFYSRQVVKEKRSERVMTIIDENFVIADIIYDNKIEPVKVRGKMEDGITISGENYYKGIVGFTGNFRGWFRNDTTFLPIKSDFEIWVGRIRIFLATEEEQRQHKYAR